MSILLKVSVIFLSDSGMKTFPLFPIPNEEKQRAILPVKGCGLISKEAHCPQEKGPTGISFSREKPFQSSFAILSEA